MQNSEIYRRTLRFSLMRVLCAIVGTLVFIALPAGTFAVCLSLGAGEVPTAVACIVACILGIVVFALIARYAGYLFTAGQIAMIAKGVTEGELPQDAYAAGRQAVKRNFVRASVYFGLLSVTRLISGEITRGLNAVAAAVDGPAGNAGPASAITGVISTVISVVVEYLNYCSLGWVFIHEGQNAFKSTCDGAVIYFQNWKVLLKNAVKIIVITLVSLLVIGGIFFALAFFIMGAIPPLAAAFAQADAAATMGDGSPTPPGTSLAVVSVVVAFMLWLGVHGALVQPYILISVMRRYIEAGLANPPKMDLYGKLAGMSKGFRKALSQSGLEGKGSPAA